jgi:hypothetical protein
LIVVEDPALLRRTGYLGSRKLIDPVIFPEVLKERMDFLTILNVFELGVF